MLVSASRRTDIPAFYADWFFTRLREGYALVRNPMNPRQVRRIELTPEAVDGIVFWTKNAAPMLDRLRELDGYACYFQFTITAFGPEVEPRLPDKNGVIIPAFRRLADTLGPERVIWRYDPIALSPQYDRAFHLRAFTGIARALAGYTHRVIFSFVDFYRTARPALRRLGMVEIMAEEQLRLAASLAEIARACGLAPAACAEAIDMRALGIEPARCVDNELPGRLAGRALPYEKDKSQRATCGCSRSVDIGEYATCRHGCLYCYASRGYAPERIAARARAHIPASPLLTGEPGRHLDAKEAR